MDAGNVCWSRFDSVAGYCSGDNMKKFDAKAEYDRISKMRAEYKRFPRFPICREKSKLFIEIELAMRAYDTACMKERYSDRS